MNLRSIGCSVNFVLIADSISDKNSKSLGKRNIDIARPDLPARAVLPTL